MKVPYFPGCTLYTKAKTFDRAGKAAAAKLGFELAELDQWTCCGAAFPLAEDYHMGLASPTRVLANACKEGGELVTLCAVCHNVLKRTNHVMRTNPERREKVTGTRSGGGLVGPLAGIQAAIPPGAASRALDRSSQVTRR